MPPRGSGDNEDSSALQHMRHFLKWDPEFWENGTRSLAVAFYGLSVVLGCLQMGGKARLNH
jgi:hypothetical protein